MRRRFVICRSIVSEGTHLVLPTVKRGISTANSTCRSMHGCVDCPSAVQLCAFRIFAKRSAIRAKSNPSLPYIFHALHVLPAMKFAGSSPNVLHGLFRLQPAFTHSATLSHPAAICFARSAKKTTRLPLSRQFTLN